MALVNINFESKFLRSNNDVSIILPDRPRRANPREFYENGKKYKVLLLLHGTFGDHTDWLRHTNIELYACERDCIVVMPSAINTYFENWPGFGPGYFMQDFLMEELMPMIHNWFPASSAREDNFVAGLSMGAIGAAKILVEHPDQFGGGAMLSAFPLSEQRMRERLATIRDQSYEELRQVVDDYRSPFDPEFQAFRLINDRNNAGSDEAYIKQKNLWPKMKEMVQNTFVPRMYFACGVDDPNYRSFRALQNYIREIGLEATFEEGPGGHTWHFWDDYIQKGMDFLGIEPRRRR